MMAANVILIGKSPAISNSSFLSLYSQHFEDFRHLSQQLAANVANNATNSTDSHTLIQQTLLTIMPPIGLP